jgi:hypothetical protein
MLEIDNENFGFLFKSVNPISDNHDLMIKTNIDVPMKTQYWSTNDSEWLTSKTTTTGELIEEILNVSSADNVIYYFQANAGSGKSHLCALMEAHCKQQKKPLLRLQRAWVGECRNVTDIVKNMVSSVQSQLESVFNRDDLVEEAQVILDEVKQINVATNFILIFSEKFIKMANNSKEMKLKDDASALSIAYSLELSLFSKSLRIEDKGFWDNKANRGVFDFIPSESDLINATESPLVNHPEIINRKHTPTSLINWAMKKWVVFNDESQITLIFHKIYLETVARVNELRDIIQKLMNLLIKASNNESRLLVILDDLTQGAGAANDLLSLALDSQGDFGETPATYLFGSTKALEDSFGTHGLDVETVRQRTTRIQFRESHDACSLTPSGNINLAFGTELISKRMSAIITKIDNRVLTEMTCDPDVQKMFPLSPLIGLVLNEQEGLQSTRYHIKIHTPLLDKYLACNSKDFMEKILVMWSDGEANKLFKHWSVYYDEQEIELTSDEKLLLSAYGHYVEQDDGIIRILGPKKDSELINIYYPNLKGQVDDRFGRVYCDFVKSSVFIYPDDNKGEGQSQRQNSNHLITGWINGNFFNEHESDQVWKDRHSCLLSQTAKSIERLGVSSNLLIDYRLPKKDERGISHYDKNTVKFGKKGTPYVKYLEIEDTDINNHWNVHYITRDVFEYNGGDLYSFLSSGGIGFLEKALLGVAILAHHKKGSHYLSCLKNDLNLMSPMLLNKEELHISEHLFAILLPHVAIVNCRERGKKDADCVLSPKDWLKLVKKSIETNQLDEEIPRELLDPINNHICEVFAKLLIIRKSKKELLDSTIRGGLLLKWIGVYLKLPFETWFGGTQRDDQPSDLLKVSNISTKNFEQLWPCIKENASINMRKGQIISSFNSLIARYKPITNSLIKEILSRSSKIKGRIDGLNTSVNFDSIEPDLVDNGLIIDGIVNKLILHIGGLEKINPNGLDDNLVIYDILHSIHKKEIPSDILPNIIDGYFRRGEEVVIKLREDNKITQDHAEKLPQPSVARDINSYLGTGGEI